MYYHWLALNGVSRIIIVASLILQIRIMHVNCHGRMMDPPARNSMWRFGYPNPVNYNDNELYCGGYSVQWSNNGGKCGICGDPYHLRKPRPHEAGGTYGRGIISRYYYAGQTIDIEIELTSNHRGRFEIFLCPNNDPRFEATQTCLDRYPLYVYGTREVRYLIPPESPKKQTFHYQVRLPPYLTCTQCVLQWTYYTGNMWGTCDNGTEAVGCGKPETFRNCADIRIVPTESYLPPQLVNSAPPYSGRDRFNAPIIEHQNVVRTQLCFATKKYRIIPGMDNWCEINCLNYPPLCPPDFCTCPQDCVAVGAMKGQVGADEYCQDKCLVYGSKCPKEKCKCT